MSNPPIPTPAPGWWINFLRDYIIRPWLWVKRKMRAIRSWLWRMIKAPFRLVARKPKELVDEVTDAASDAISDDDPYLYFRKLRHRSHSDDSLAVVSTDGLSSIIPDASSSGSGGGGFSGGSGYSGGGSSGMLDGCGDGCLDGCDGCDGCAFDLMLMTFGVFAVRGAALYKIISFAVRKR